MRTTYVVLRFFIEYIPEGKYLVHLLDRVVELTHGDRLSMVFNTAHVVWSLMCRGRVKECFINLLESSAMHLLKRG